MKCRLRSARATREADELLWRNDATIDRCRDLLLERRMALHQHELTRRIARFDPERRRLLTGHATQHRSPGARRWRLRLRLKARMRQPLTLAV